MKRTTKNYGFSLVELIIVIAIMAILAAALAPALIKYVKKSRNQTYIEIAENIQLAAETMIVDAGEDSYSIRGIVYNGSKDSSVGSGTIYYQDGENVSTMSSTDAAVYFESLFSTLQLGGYSLYTSNDKPLILAVDNLQIITSSDSETGLTTHIILSNNSGSKMAELEYIDGEWSVID